MTDIEDISGKFTRQCSCVKPETLNLNDLLKKLPYHIRFKIIRYLDRKTRDLLIPLAETCPDLILSNSSDIWSDFDIHFKLNIDQAFDKLLDVDRIFGNTVKSYNFDCSEISQQEYSRISLKLDEIPDELKSKVKTLDLSDTRFGEDFVNFRSPLSSFYNSGLVNVRNIKLSDCPWLTGREVHSIATEYQVERLDVSLNSTLDENFLTDLFNTKSIVYRIVTPDLVPVKVFTSSCMVSLNLLECRSIDIHCLIKISENLPNLEELYLDGDSMTDSCSIHISALEKLKILHIMYLNERLGDEFLDNFWKYSKNQKFTNLKLTHQQFSSQAWDNFLSNKIDDNLKVLELGSTDINDNHLCKILDRCRSLKILLLDWNDKITDFPFFKYYKNMLEIEKLSLVGCRDVKATNGEEKWFSLDLIERYWLKLRSISFVYCDFVDDKVLSDIVTQRHWLEIQDYRNETVKFQSD